MSIFEKKKKCLICSKRMRKEYSSIKYRYEQEKIGTAYLCKKCTEGLDTNQGETEHDETV